MIAARAASRSAAVRDTSTTSQPSSANTSAQARPIPFEAPVTNALRPRNPSSIAFSTQKPAGTLPDFAPGQFVLVVKQMAQLRPWNGGETPGDGMIGFA